MSTKGFTLLEMVVVLVLIGLSASITLPRLSQTVDAVNAGVEERTFLELIDSVRLRAFLRQKNITLHFSDHSISIDGENEPMAFQLLQFEEQNITWNGNGFPNAPVIRYELRGLEKELAMF